MALPAARTPRPRVAPARVPRRTSASLPDLERAIERHYRRATDHALRRAGISTADEWLLDNFHVVRRALRTIRTSLVRGFERRLRPGAGPDDARPRVHGLAHQILAGREAALDHDALVRALRKAAPELAMADLWAFPLFLRLALLERLRAALDRFVPSPAGAGEGGAAAARGESARDREVAESVRGLVSAQGIDWRRVFEAVSRVERALADDPAGVYARMDFETRDRYRKRVEEIARRTSREEVAVARAAVAASRARGGEHVGVVLLGPGREAFERSLGFRPPWGSRLRRFVRRHATWAYLGSIGLGTVLQGALLLAVLLAARAGAAIAVPALVLALAPAVTVAVSLVNACVTWWFPPSVLPKMDYEEGLPAGRRAAVVVPCLLTDAEEIAGLVGHLEVRYLGNRDARLSYVLLADHPDAHRQHMPRDDALREAAARAIEDLNAKYGDGGTGPFLLLLRGRRWNPRQGCWMGWERKRGKLQELGRLLDGRRTTYEHTVGDPALLERVDYVITLDADTSLPHGAARRLVATLDHPLNRARFDRHGRVVGGYTILQPRVEVTPLVTAASRFARFFHPERGLDPYTRAVSDAYQDLFGEGIYVGKGIYDVRAFRRSLRGRAPENALLSHDLFEGIHGRAALVSDIVVYEDYPTTYLAYARRLHRWIRGDWQLVPWLRRQVPGFRRRVPSRLSLISRWKIADNLRRSLLTPSLLALLLLAWTVLPGPVWAWTLLFVALPILPTFMGVTDSVLRGTRTHGLRRAVVEAAGDMPTASARWAMEIVCLPYEAALTLDAIVRTLVRVGFTRVKLLEWTPAAHVARRLRGDTAGGAWRAMAAAPAIACLAVGLVCVLRPSALPAALPVLAAWVFAPALARWLSRPLAPAPQVPIDAQDRRALRMLARRTWLWFETTMGPENQWLPPDHLQEAPVGRVAHRTSPTNIGMGLLATVAAVDFGYLGPHAAAAMLRNTLGTVLRLERHDGHPLNWYDTESLLPLHPRYVSTVDNGNLAAALMVLREACLEIARGHPGPRRLWRGAEDLVALLCDALAHLGARERDPAVPVLRARAAALREGLQAARVEADADPEPRRRALAEQADTLATSLAEKLAGWGETEGEHALAEVGLWMQRLQIHLRAFGRELELSASAAAGGAEATLGVTLSEVVGGADRLLADMDFGRLYDRERKLFRLGFDLEQDAPDPNHYDLLASEARLASFVAIAKGDVPFEHWLQLGRPVGRVAGRPALLSWGGTLFEYLLPPLLAQEDGASLLHVSCQAAIERQIAYARGHDVPWGVSESGYYAFDADHNYQYRSFGVPGLGFRRGLEDDLVVAPYASLMALPLRPRAVVANLARLVAAGGMGRFGLYEALDYTRLRLPAERGCAVVRSWMAHHQGMILLALDHYLLDGLMPRRLHRDPSVRAVELLLHEGAPRRPEIERPQVVSPAAAPTGVLRVAGRPWAPSLQGAWPEVWALSNGRLTSFVSARSAGHLSWKQYALTRAAPDATLEEDGLWIHVRDEARGDGWIVGRPQPGATQFSRCTFWPHAVRFQHRQADLSADLEVVVDPEEDVEVRRLVLANRSDELRHVTVASHAEVCLAPEREDRRHPAFSKLFVESRYLAREHALLFRRRPRAPQERPPVLLHALLSSPRARTRIGHDASRETFLGRLRRRARPCALDASPVVLAGTTGATLDPVLALSASFDLAPRAYVELAWVTVVGESEAEVRRIAARRRSFAAADRTVDAARIYGDALLRRRGIDPDSVPAIQRLLSLLRHPHHALRAPPAVLASSCQTVEVLWRHGISGDRPIVLVRVRDEDDVGFLAQVLRAHGLLRVLGVASDLVAFDETGTGYASNAQDRLRRALEASALHDVRGAAGGVFPVQANRLPPAEHDFLLAVARVVLDPHAGDLETQLGAPYRVPPRLPGLVTTESVPRPTASLEDVGPRLFDNGMGGFSPDGTAYVIRLDEEEVTPAPWCNVLANPHFGALVSESGGGCTWSENAALHRLTPWRNDPLQDAPTEALYLRDEETGAVWSPTPRPAPGPGPYEVRHEAGRTRFRHASQALEQRLDVFVAADDPVKVFHLSLRNRMAGHRRLTVTFFAEWILGEDPVAHGPYVVPTYHRDEEVLVAHGLLGADQPARVAFAATTRPLHGLTADRTEFLGRCGRRDHPAALDRVGLAGTVEPGRDPCAALQVHVDLAPGGEAQVAFLLGQAESEEAAISCVRRAREPEFVARALQRVRSTWEGLLGSLQVRTPEPALDLFVNRWLRLATVAGRLFGRIGPYQASGAFGFRDQLQDVLALVGGWPDVVRAHLLRAAAHQFPEGDVLHWWHPLTGVGVRTRCSDDLLWLPFAVAQYVEATGDRAVLAETVRFLAGAPLEDGEDERYARYDPGSEAASLHEHCLRALRRAQAYGSRGLPRIGTGDWNDGMNRVGREGRGESVWLGWFLGTCLRRYATVCDLLGETEHAAEKRALADRLAERVDAVAWDGAWYVRAFDDDGAPLGSSRCEEGRIDVLPQAWAALAGGGRADRAARALQSAWEHLVREDDGLVLLLAPPFDRTAKDPGYIKAYPPGVRENGGQYSHAAAWLAWAFAESGDPDRALAVFRLVLPTRHTATRAAAGRYRVEPYVVAADVYGPPQHAGRGGWTWYTGASAWLQRFAVEGLLGIRQEGDGFVFDPRLPSAWDGYEAVLRRGSTVWKVRVRRGTPAAGAVEVRLDGRALPEARVPRREDGAEHAVEVTVR